MLVEVLTRIRVELIVLVAVSKRMLVDVATLVLRTVLVEVLVTVAAISPGLISLTSQFSPVEAQGDASLEHEQGHGSGECVPLTRY